MRSKLILLVFISTVFLTCQENNVSDAYLGKNLCVLLEQMRDNDQKYRDIISKNVQKLNILFKERKKLTSTNRLSKVEIKKLTERLTKENYPDLTDVELLTIIELQTELDNKNTELLLDIVKKRGYPNENNTVCDKYAGMIFRHSQSKYFDEVKPLIEDELKKGNINKATYDFFIDYINGRPFDPRF